VPEAYFTELESRLIPMATIPLKRSIKLREAHQVGTFLYAFALIVAGTKS
jgi:hypothetical protein